MGSLARLCFFVSITICVLGCQPSHQERPFGFIKLGSLSDLTEDEKYLSDARILLRRDSQGLWAMSTMCTKDLSSLSIKENSNGTKVWQSSYSDSVYSWGGKVIHGPAVRNLPYFRLKIEPGIYGGPPDTLFAVVGEEVDENWRLPLG